MSAPKARARIRVRSPTRAAEREPTVTDANVLLGRLDIQNVLPGTDSPRPKVRAAFEELGKALGTTAEGAAQAAIKRHRSQHGGRDPQAHARAGA